MIINSKNIDESKLWPAATLLDHLRTNGASDRILADVRRAYEEAFGVDLTWRYPLSDGVHAGTTIVAVREGFLCLPYDRMDASDYELFDLDSAYLMDGGVPGVFIMERVAFSNDLLSSLCDMQRFLIDVN